jgi:hypothetical protein
MLPVTAAFSDYPFAATVCFNLAASTRFLQLPGMKRFLLPTRRRSDFLGVFRFSFESLLTHNSSELLHPTQPKLQSALILQYCKQLCKTPKSVSEETSLKVHFSCEMVTSIAFIINSLAFLAISLLYCTNRGCLRSTFFATSIALKVDKCYQYLCWNVFPVFTRYRYKWDCSLSCHAAICTPVTGSDRIQHF